MNGCLIIGTWDGANIEIAEETGVDNVFVFGVRADEINQLRKVRPPLIPGSGAKPGLATPRSPRLSNLISACNLFTTRS